MKEYLKSLGIWCWRIIEMIGELLVYIITIAFTFWIVSVIVIFILIAWYLGLVG